MLEPETFEKLEDTIKKIKEKSSEKAAIIVEGKEDEKSLRELGISGPIHQIPHHGQTVLNSLEDLSDYEEAIILTDFDQTGEKLAIYCEKQLRKLSVDIDKNLREDLRAYVRKAVKDIEGISTFIKTERNEQSKNTHKKFQE